MADEPAQRSSVVGTVLSGPGLATIAVALVTQAVFSIAFQIKNNEQQSAAIAATATELSKFEASVMSMQTPLGAVVIKLDGHLSGLESTLRSLEARLTSSDTSLVSRIDTIDKGGTRALEAVIATQQRTTQIADRLAERLLLTDQRISDLATRVTLLSELVARNDKILDQMARGRGYAPEKDQK